MLNDELKDFNQTVYNYKKKSFFPEFFYDVVTVGAPTAHSLKYKSGGLRRMIENTDENTRKILEG